MNYNDITERWLVGAPETCFKYNILLHSVFYCLVFILRLLASSQKYSYSPLVSTHLLPLAISKVHMKPLEELQAIPRDSDWHIHRGKAAGGSLFFLSVPQLGIGRQMPCPAERPRVGCRSWWGTAGDIVLGLVVVPAPYFKRASNRDLCWDG